MKQLLTLTFSLSFSLIFAQQRVTIIDKTADKDLLFDQQHSQSLVSLFNNNSLPFNPTSYYTSIRLANAGFMENKPFRIGNQSDIPLSNIYGDDSIATFNGVLQYVYPMPDQYFTDFNCSDPRIDLYKQYLHEAGIQLEVSIQETWKTALLKERINGKKYSVSNKRDLKKLTEEFQVLEDVIH